MSKKLGDLPTMELGRDVVAKYARQADAEVLQADADGQRVTRRPEPDTELEINVDFDELALAYANDSLRDDGVPDDHPSHVRTRQGDTFLELARVPCIIVCKEDLEWFEVEESAKAVLARIDGESTVETIVSTVPVARETAIGILGELLTHGVIELQ